jgi:hypothetical protein
VAAVWYFHSREGSAFVEAASAVNVKRTWVDYGLGESRRGGGELVKLSRRLRMGGGYGKEGDTSLLL